MKKISFVRERFNPYGGAERYFQRLIEEIEQRKEFEVELLEFPQPKWLVSWIKNPLYNYQACRQKGNRFYFSNDRLTCLDIHRAGGGTHKAFLKTKGLSLNPLHPVNLWLEKRTLKNAKIIIANSKKVKQDILDSYDIPENKIVVIYNGVPIRSFDKTQAKFELVDEFEIPLDAKILLYVGSGFRRKGVRELLEILSKIREKFVAFIVGKEKNIEKYQKLSRQLNLSNKVFFTGPRKDVERFYAASDIFVFPTHYEPFSNVVLEALSYETVVFTTKQNGASEILESTFVMEHPRDFSVCQKIEHLLEDVDLLKTEQKKARELAKRFSIESNTDKTIEVIKKALFADPMGKK